MKFSELKQLIREGDFERVRDALVQHPDLIHVRDPEDWEELTALHCAARYARLDIVKLLVEQGAEVYSHPHNSYPAVFIANQFRHFPDRPNGQRVVDYFLQEIPDRAEGTLGLGVTIQIAARLGVTDIVRKHIELDPLAVHQRGWLGDTPLHWASHNGHVEIVSMLLDAGADIEADEINCYGGKPLHWASEHAPAVVELLLASGAKVNSRNQRRQSDLFGVTPLLMNAIQGDDCAEVTQLLVDAGADLNAQYQGKTALEHVQENGNARIAAVLQTASGVGRTFRLISEVPKSPSRPADAHKGTFGHVLLIAGSRGMAGAASLAGQAALHGGAGLVTVALPSAILSDVAAAHPSYMTVPLPNDKAGCIDCDLVELLASCLARSSVVAVGPGLGRSEAVSKAVRELYANCELPLVVDADALNALAGELDSLGDGPQRSPRVLTPHPGEFGRLTGQDVTGCDYERTRQACEFASRQNVVLLLKGPRTIITDGERVAVNQTGCSALATGGSGDVLTGLIAALIAQGMSAFEATQLAAHLHGLAGEAAAKRYPSPYVTSVEILEMLAHAWGEHPS